MKPTVLLYGDGACDNYAAALDAFGAAVCREAHLAASCGGLLLPGGGDIKGVLDEPEYLLIQSFVATNRPVLGICRGMQALNVFFGGTLYDRIGGHQLSHGDFVHPTHARGWVARLLGETPAVTSNHHQAVCALGAELAAVQWADDGIIEALCHERLPVWGVQWHPERQSCTQRRTDAVDAGALWKAFVEQMR